MSLIVYVTCADKDEAENISLTLIRERLAACANFFPISSIYAWEGDIKESDEYLLVCKTVDELYERLEARVIELHSYDVPVIEAVEVKHANSKAVEWLKQNTL